MKLIAAAAIVTILSLAIYLAFFNGRGYEIAVATSMEHVKGNGDAEIVEFSDFQCPACASAYPLVKELMEKYDGKIRLRYRHFPLPFHSNAMFAAEAAECAAEEGKFWEFHDTLFENQQEWSKNRDKIYEYAEKLGLNMSFFRACVKSHATRPRIERDIAAARENRISGTPTFIINGRVVYANQLEREIQRAIGGSE